MLKSIEITHFRNLEIKKIEISPLLILVGENRSGKTNFLEAVYFLSHNRSFRKVVGKALIKEGYFFSRIVGEVLFQNNLIEGLKREKTKKIEIILTKEKERGSQKESCFKKIKIDGFFKKNPQLSKYFSVISFSPQDVILPFMPPSFKRRYFNNLLYQIDPSFLTNLKTYKKIIQSKNIILKNKKGDLDFWNEKLAEEATKIYLKRKKILNHLNGIFPLIYSRLFGQQIDFKIEYKSHLRGKEKSISPGSLADNKQVEAEIFHNFLNQLKEKKEEETKRGFSFLGTHRDDFLFILNKNPLAFYGSQGERRLAVLALKFGELKLIEEILNIKPALLLDDVFSELDEKRRDLLSSLFKRQQTIVTTTDIDHIAPHYRKEAQIFQIKEGKILR